ncbi:potassium channel family protein [Kribbella sp. NPDC051952]|uniref:potassium channel family protein n=1 Tax=Kribbella sp. NPDC051952 TaxID=3154851 RepID=UPI00344769B2
MGRDAFVERYERRAEWPLTLAAGVFLAAYAWPVLEPDMPDALRRACSIVTVAIWVIFAGDFLLRLALVRRRVVFLRTHIVDLLVLALPLLRPLRALRVVTALTRLNRRAESSLRGRAMVYVVAGVGLLGFTTAVAVLDAERSRPDANIRTFGDASWWAVTTITTVGYGDRYPTTNAGRIAGVGLMLGGIALLGVVTAALASWFVEHVAREERDESDLRRQILALTIEVRALRTEVAHTPEDQASPEPPVHTDPTPEPSAATRLRP